MNTRAWKFSQKESCLNVKCKLNSKNVEQICKNWKNLYKKLFGFVQIWIKFYKFSCNITDACVNDVATQKLIKYCIFQIFLNKFLISSQVWHRLAKCASFVGVFRMRYRCHSLHKYSISFIWSLVIQIHSHKVINKIHLYLFPLNKVENSLVVLKFS